MGEYVVKLPDVGEGVVEAELTEWLVAEGEFVREDQAIGAIMTDKATVEIPSPVGGKVIWLGPKCGETVAVGSPIVRLDVVGEGNAEPDSPQTECSVPETEAAQPGTLGAMTTAKDAVSTIQMSTEDRASPLASPAVRKRALEAGIDLSRVAGSAPAGRITHEDLDRFVEHGAGPAQSKARSRNTAIEEIPLTGLRRKICEKMALSKAHIAHITYVEEIDVTALEELRTLLNAGKRDDQSKLTLIPFLMRAMARAIAEQPQMNSHYDDDTNIIHRYGGVHMGIATQTDKGLVVPVARHVEALGLWQCAAETARLSSAARRSSLSREELSGSTITLTSLGAMGGIATTPIINYPEVAIIGVNKIRWAPHWDGTGFVPRQVMNLSSSFDHRIIDGWDAAVFIQRIKGFLEAPATLFIED